MHTQSFEAKSNNESKGRNRVSDFFLDAGLAFLELCLTFSQVLKHWLILLLGDTGSQCHLLPLSQSLLTSSAHSNFSLFCNLIEIFVSIINFGINSQCLILFSFS